MTSALQRLQANEDDTIWRQNAPMIRQLYQEERKTLKEVKAIMENEQGFPVTSPCVWEIKLRGLGMQKKLKSRDWSLVYQHVRPRLQHEGKKKLRKPTAILINDTEKPWDDVWKEIRRNRALSQRPHRGPLPPLPPGIVIRTPSPELLDTALRGQKPRSPQYLILQLFQTTLVSLQPLFELDSQSKAEPGDAFEYPTPDSVYKLCLQGIPFTMLLEKISGSVQGALPSPHTVARLGESQDDQITPASRPSDNTTAAGHTTSWKSQLTGIFAQLLPEFESAPPNGQELELNFDSHHYLSMVIYLLSNNLVRMVPRSHDEVDISEVLQMTFTFVSRRLLLSLLRSHLPSVRAAWEKLFDGAQELKNEEAFRFLISVGMDNDWLEEDHRGHEYLFSAAQMNCSDIFRALIDRGCSVGPRPRWCFHKSVIVEILDNGNLDCARLFIQHCDVNHEFHKQYDSHKSTHFADFMMVFDDAIPDDSHCLELFLAKGADVDYILHSGQYSDHMPRDMMEYWMKATKYGFDDDWPLSILDCVYYFHRPLFPELAMYSEGPFRFSRARALWHLDQGVDALREYLASVPDFSGSWGKATGNDKNKANIPERKNRCLEVLLAEQLLLSRISPEENIWWSRVKGLSELEIDLTWLSKKGGLAGNMLYATACLITSEEATDKENGLQIMQWLLDQGFQVKADALCAALQDDTGTILEYLSSFCDDLEKEGGKALIRATVGDIFDATKLLLDRGADPNIIDRDKKCNVFEAAACNSSLAMMKYLAQRGAKPRIYEEGYHPSCILTKMFRRRLSWHVDDILNKVKYITNEHIAIDEPSCPSARLLEMCLCRANPDKMEQSREIFEFLLKKGARLGPGSPLAEWITTGGGHQLVQEMLDAGADPNAHSFDENLPFFDAYHPYSRTPLQAAASVGDYPLVCMLMERGADLNRPAVGVNGVTALQAICAWDPLRREERLRKDKIIALLLEKGADVNAASPAGRTALICAAELGDLSTAFTLLKHGAKVDAMGGYYGQENDCPRTALDVAASCGGLDMVQFLLNANALSSSASFDGKDYDGAIELAKKHGHFVVSELIRKHSADRKRWDVPPGQAIETNFLPEHAPQSLSLRARSGTSTWSQTQSWAMPSENLQGVKVLDHTDGRSYAFDESMVDSSTAASKARGNGVSGAEPTDVICTRVIEEIEDEPPVADSGCEQFRGEEIDGTANQALHTSKATWELGGWSYQPGKQNWVEDEQQNVDLLVSSSLSTDVFMGFSEFSSP